MKIAPQLATLVAAPPKGSGWVHEIKYDGFRMIARRAGEAVHIYSRNGLDWTKRLPSVATALGKLKAKSFTIDGEAAVLDEKGASRFARMQDAMSRTDDSKVILFAFDLLEIDGADLRKKALVDRKAALRKLLARAPTRVRYGEHLDTDGAAMLKRACEMGLEGIVSKRADGHYRAGRSMDWQKSKCLLQQEFIILGYWDRSDRPKDFGALALGAYENGKLVYVGNVGTGWSVQVREALYSQMVAAETTKAPLSLPRDMPTSGLHWLRPKLVCEVKFSEWTVDQILRHPSFQGMREDKRAGEIVIERPARNPLKVYSHWDYSRGKRRR